MSHILLPSMNSHSFYPNLIPSSTIVKAGYKIKPDTFDRKGSFNQFITQFELAANFNRWTEEIRATVWTTSLRDKARSIVERINSRELTNYTVVLCNALNTRFGEPYSSQLYYKFQSRILNQAEDLPTFAGESEKLVRLAHAECSVELQDKIACAQFISGLSNSSSQEILRLEYISSMPIALKRSMEVEAIKSLNNSRSRPLTFYAQSDSSRSNVPNQNTTVWQHNVTKSNSRGC